MAWVKPAMFKDWFENCIVPEVERYLKKKNQPFKAVLLVDYEPGHPILEHSNVKVVFNPWTRELYPCTTLRNLFSAF